LTGTQVADNIGAVVMRSAYDRLVDMLAGATVGAPSIGLLLGLSGLLCPA